MNDEDKKDHCNLDVLNSATLVENARARFQKDKIYTYISQLLLAINPFKYIEVLYSEQAKEVYRGANWTQLEPHTYAIAEMSFQSMTIHNQSQSLLVSGESGAGKTETNKQLMDYIIWRAGVPAGSALAASNKASLDKRIMDTNPVLEAFGNAKSIRNNNSSRFGKYINLKFSKEWRVMGAEVRTFLLEKSRVTNASLARERSYHIFYQLLRGSQFDGKGCAQLKGKGPLDFMYTSLSGTNWVDAIDDVEDFHEFHRAMPNCGLNDEEHQEVYNVLGALLHISNVKYEAAGNDTIRIQPGASADLKTAERLLGITPIGQLLVEKVVKSPRSNNEYHIALDMGAAISQRDALVKHLYQMLFALIVQKINTQIQVERDFHRFIGLLDVFGFEVFQTNSFEQLCINYANERLHNFFLMRVFEVEIELYRMQNLQVPVLTYPDNSKVIELLEKSPTGIFPVLDAQCKTPKATDKTFNAAICKQHASHQHFSTLSGSKMKMSGVSDEDVFVIHHFAGDVCYSSASFLEKNTDSLSAQFEGILLKSTSSVVVQMVEGAKLGPKAPDNPGDQSARGKKGLEPGQMSARGEAGAMSHRGKKPGKGGKEEGDGKKASGSVSKTFLLGLKQLMREIATTHPFFIRCIKPNQKLVPKEFHVSMVLSQMERSGTIECVKLMQQGYPSRAPYADLMTRFKNALPEFMMTLNPGQFVELLLLACNCDQNDYQLGQDMVFFRSNKGGLLQELMMMRKDLVASRIVSNGLAKGYNDDPDYGQAFKELQAFVAMRMRKRKEARELFESAVMAAIQMQKWVRWGEAKTLQRSAAATHMQTVRRGRAARLQAAELRRIAEEKRLAEEAARKAAEEARLAAEAAAVAEAAERERLRIEAERLAEEARIAEAARIEAERQEAAAKKEAEEREARIAEEKRIADEIEAKRRQEEQVAAQQEAAQDALDDQDDEADQDHNKWFVQIPGKRGGSKEVHRHLMCKGVEWGFQYHNFYGDWELDTTQELCNDRPHYIHNTMYGGHAHLFHTIDPHYHVPRWVIGPSPGNENGWAFCESDALTPHEVKATWISWDGFEWHSCKSFRYEPKEHEMDGFSDEEDFEEGDDHDLYDENQFGMKDGFETNSKVNKVALTSSEYEHMMTNREAKADPKEEAPSKVQTVVEDDAEVEDNTAPGSGRDEDSSREDGKKGKKGKKGKDGKKEKGKKSK